MQLPGPGHLWFPITNQQITCRSLGSSAVDGLGLPVWCWFEQRSHFLSPTHSGLSWTADALDHTKQNALWPLLSRNASVQWDNNTLRRQKLPCHNRTAAHPTAHQMGHSGGCTNPLTFMEYRIHKRLILLILCQLRLAMWPGSYGFIAPLKELTITITHEYFLWFPAQQNAWTNQSIIYGKKSTVSFLFFNRKNILHQLIR